MSENPQKQHLRTNYVFIDTQAFRKAQFDWTGRLLSKLVELAKETDLKILITDITKGEIKSQLREALDDTATALKKHEAILKHLGAEQTLTAATDDKAFPAVEAAFEKFLKDTRAIDVPLTADLGAIFDDYFSRRPPFSEKKKFEFPDAVVVSSLLAWCKTRNATAYVVSGDPDLKMCCSESGPLFHAETVGDIISQATVSKELHDALQNALAESEQLSDLLAEQIGDLELKPGRGAISFRGTVANFSGKVSSVDDISIHYVNVIEQQDRKFTCEIEFEAYVWLDLNVEVEGQQYGYEEYDPPSFFNTTQGVTHCLSAEVVAVFDPKKPKEIEIESVHVYGNTVEISLDQVSERWFR